MLKRLLRYASITSLIWIIVALFTAQIVFKGMLPLSLEETIISFYKFLLLPIYTTITVLKTLPEAITTPIDEAVGPPAVVLWLLLMFVNFTILLFTLFITAGYLKKLIKSHLSNEQ